MLPALGWIYAVENSGISEGTSGSNQLLKELYLSGHWCILLYKHGIKAFRCQAIKKKKQVFKVLYITCIFAHAIRKKDLSSVSPKEWLLITESSLLHVTEQSIQEHPKLTIQLYNQLKAKQQT